MSGTIGGRWRNSRAAPVARPRLPPVTEIAAECLSETTEVGYSGRTAQPSPTYHLFGDNYYDHGGNGADYVTLAESSGTYSFRYMDDSVLGAGEAWFQAAGWARTDELSSADMTVTATVSGVLASMSYYLLARSFHDPNTTWPLAADNPTTAESDLEFGQTGWRCLFTDTYVQIDGYYVSSVDNPGNLQYLYVGDASHGVTFAGGEVLELVTTGSGSGTVLEAKIDGVSVLSLDNTDLTAALSGSGDSLADMPDGLRAGLGMEYTSGSVPLTTFWNHADDDTASLNAFEACPL